MRSHRLRSVAGASGGAASPVFHYDFGDTSCWNGSSTTINDLSGNGNNTTFTSTSGLSQTTIGGASCLEASTNYCVTRGTYNTPSGVGNVGTGDYAIQFVWNPYLRPHGANYYYSTAQMTLLNGGSGSTPTFGWTEGGLLFMGNVSGNSYTPAFPTAHNKASNAAPAHTVNAPYPSTPVSYTSGSPHRNSSPYMGYGQGWEHAIITRRSGALYAYQNGTQTASYVNNDSYSTFSGATVLGSGWATDPNYCGYNSWYLGALAIHKFFDTGLTDAQVTDIFDAEKSRFSL